MRWRPRTVISTWAMPLRLTAWLGSLGIVQRRPDLVDAGGQLVEGAGVVDDVGGDREPVVAGRLGCDAGLGVLPAPPAVADHPLDLDLGGDVDDDDRVEPVGLAGLRE